jgi:hypothetical protein
MTYDAWKLRSDRDDDWWNEPEPEAEEEEESDMDEITKQINDALEKDFPASKLAHKPIGNSGEPGEKPARATATEQINATIAEFQALIRVLERVRDRL